MVGEEEAVGCGDKEDTDTAEEAARVRKDAQREVENSVGLMTGFGLIDEAQSRRVLNRVSYLSRADAPAALAEADVVFEGVPEVLDLKEVALKFIESWSAPSAISRSSSSFMAA